MTETGPSSDTETEEGRWERACSVSDLPPGEIMRIDWRPRLALINLHGEFYAVEDRCTHEDFPLSDGYIVDDKLECAYHGAQYVVETGEPLSILAERPLRTFPARVEGDDVLIFIPPSIET